MLIDHCHRWKLRKATQVLYGDTAECLLDILRLVLYTSAHKLGPC